MMKALLLCLLCLLLKLHFPIIEIAFQEPQAGDVPACVPVSVLNCNGTATFLIIEVWCPSTPRPSSQTLSSKRSQNHKTVQTPVSVQKSS